MKTLLAIILASGSLNAQNALWIDLSGPWLSRAGEDRPEFAQPGFDDRNWTPYVLPASFMETRAGYLWLRKTVDLPAGTPGHSLALTLGTWNHSYEVYVNGTLAGASGNSTERGHQIPRPRTFFLPPLEKPRITIAIRSLRSQGLPAVWRGEAAGPFLLTGTAQAPKDLAVSYFNQLRVRNTAELAFGLLIGGLGLLLWLAWLREQSRKPLLWFAVSLLAHCSVTLLRFSGLLSETFDPYRWVLLEQLLSSLQTIAFIGSVASVYEFRPPWIRLLIWVWPLPALVAKWNGNNSDVFRYALAVLSLSAIPLAAFGWWRSRFKLDRRQVLLAAALCTTLLNFANSYVGLGLFPSRLRLGPFAILLFQLCLLILAILIAWELLTRLREDGLESVRLKGEMQAARLVQQLFLATRPAHIDVVYEPAQEVGGDFAFVFPLDDGGHLIAAGDVSGKGLKAAMIVSVIAGALRNRRANEPAELLAELNRALAGGPDHGFVTAIIVRCTPRGELQLASAGNPPPYLAGFELEMAAGLPLGISLDASYATQTAALQEGEQLTLVSDGVVEAENAQRELFGFDRTREISTQSAQEIAEAAKSWGQNDDITVVTVGRKNA